MRAETSEDDSRLVTSFVMLVMPRLTRAVSNAARPQYTVIVRRGIIECAPGPSHTEGRRRGF